MEATAPTSPDAPKQRRRRRGIVMPVLVLGVTGFGIASLVNVSGSDGALFGSEDPAGREFPNGTLLLSAERLAEFEVQAANLNPGDTTTGALTVGNVGSMEQEYRVSSALEPTGPKNRRYANALETRVTDAAGAVLYEGPMSDLVIEPRVLAPLADESLDVDVTLPLGVGDGFQGRSATWVLHFDGQATGE